MIRKYIRYGAFLAVAGLMACEDALVVENADSPDAERVMKTPEDAEALLGSYFKRWYTGVHGSTAVEGRLNVWSLMNFSSLANNCQNNSYPFGSANINNSPGNPCGGDHYTLYRIESEVNRVASSILRKMDGADGDPLTFGTVARDNRARAFAEMLRGLSLGYLALIYDSAAVVSAQMTDDDPGTLVAYTEVMDSAYAALDRAEAIALDPASSSVTAGGFPLPASWIPTAGERTFNSAEFIRLVRSYRARFRVNVARDQSTHETGTDWNAVLADAGGGFQTDFNIKTGGTDGTTTGGWRTQYNSFATWHQMPPFYIGMADTSGSYATWLAQPLGERGGGNVSFTMVTPDLRWPQGTTRTAQQTDFVLSSCETAATKCKRYFWNRPAADDQFSGQGWGFSNYNFVRFRSWQIRGDAGTARDGKTPYFLKSELRLIAAEAHFRLGNLAAARDSVNVSRTLGMLCQNGTTPGGTNCTAAQAVAWGGGLPAIVAADNVTPVPGGNACVPKIPIPPAYNAVACGSLFEALKYEKRIETAYVGHTPWWLDGRGWGDNPKDTPVHLPVPYQDWLARNKPANLIYHTGAGSGTAPGSASPLSNYGW